MADNLVINELERAVSADINNLQRLQSRQLADTLRHLGTLRRYPAQAPISGADTTQSPQTWHLGLTVEKVGSQYMVNAGMMSSVSPSNLTLDPLDPVQPIGILRAPAIRSIPVCNPARTSGEFYLISARVVSVVTLNTVVEIFDVPTQAFIPVAKNKRIEFQLEFREDAGPQVPSLPTLGAYPALNAHPVGDGWDPIAIIKTYVNTATADYGEVTDVRRDLRDLLRAAPHDPFPEDPATMQPEVLTRSIQSANSPSDPTWGRGFTGQFRALYRGGEYSASARHSESIPSTKLFVNDLSPQTPGYLNHYYLVPFKTGSNIRVPSVGWQGSIGGIATTRGILVQCQSECPPTREGKNSGLIQLPRTGVNGLFTAYDQIAPGEAVWVYSATSKNTGATDLLPFVMTRQRLVYPVNAAHSDQLSAPRCVDFALQDGSNVISLPLAVYVPPNVRWVELAVRLSPGGLAAGPARCEVKVAKEDAKIGVPGTSALTTNMVLDSISIGTGHPNTEWWGKLRVPIFVPSFGDPIPLDGYLSLAIEFEYQTLSGSTFGSCQASVYVAGWEV